MGKRTNAPVDTPAPGQTHDITPASGRVPELAEGKTVIRRRMLAVDPGDTHCGMAEFVETVAATDAEDAAHDGPTWTGLSAEGWECIRAWEYSPDECADYAASLLSGGRLDLLIVEEFRLYPDKARDQSYSSMQTAQLIGVLRYLVRLFNSAHQREGATVVVCSGQADWWEQQPSQQQASVPPYHWVTDTSLVLQPAGIKEPTAGVLRAQGIASEAKASGAGGHALDAELHGWHYALRQIGVA